jgi:hypothetical protein
MNINATEDGIFERWRSRHPNLVRDGVADEIAYASSSPKILFVLKEVNDPDGGGWDLREYIRGGGRAQTWNAIARWVTGIAALPQETPWETVAEVSDTTRIAALRSIAAMNLKKSPGGSSTEYGSLEAIARADSDLLAEQFRLYNADLVICCGGMVGELVDEVLQLDPTREWRRTTRGVWYKEYVDRKFVLDYAHPQARSWQNLLFYGLVDAVKELRHSAA